MLAGSFGNNEKAILTILDEILMMNDTSLFDYKKYINSLPKKDGWI